MTQKQRRLFTAEQKAEALRMIEQAAKPVSQGAQELGIGVSPVHTWMRQSKIHRQGDPKGPLTSAERKELVALRCELEGAQVCPQWLLCLGSLPRFPERPGAQNLV